MKRIVSGNSSQCCYTTLERKNRVSGGKSRELRRETNQIILVKKKAATDHRLTKGDGVLSAPEVA